MGWKGEFTKPVMVGRLGTCLSMGAGRARMEHEKNGVGRKGEGEEEQEEEEMVVDRRTWLRGRRWAAGCRQTARALPTRGPGPGSQPAAAL